MSTEAGHVVARLSAVLDESNFNKFDARIKQAEQKEARVKLGADLAELNRDLAKANAEVKEFEKKRAEASAREVGSSAALLREARKRQELLVKQVAEQKKAAENLKREAAEVQKLLNLDAQRAAATREVARQERERAAAQKKAAEDKRRFDEASERTERRMAAEQAKADREHAASTKRNAADRIRLEKEIQATVSQTDRNILSSQAARAAVFRSNTAQVERYNRELSGTRRALFGVEAAAGGAGRNLNRVGRDLSHGEVSARAFARAMGHLSPGLNFATRIPVYRLAAIGTTIAGIVPPVVALTSALGPLTGLLGLLPGLALTAGGAFATLTLGLRGIGDAAQAAWQAQNKAAAGTAVAASTVRSSTRQIADAQRDATRAQEDLTKAREQAVQNLEDMRLALEEARRAEIGDQLSVRDATAALDEVERNSESTALDLAQARYDLREAERRLHDDRRNSAAQAKELDDAERAGVERSPEVVAARQAAADAERRVAEAQADAADTAAKASGATNQLAEKMANLSPAGQHFVRFLQSDLFPVVRRLRSIAQEGLLPGVEQGFRSALQNGPLVARVIRNYADALGDAAAAQGELVGEGGVGRDLGTIFAEGEQRIRQTATAAFELERGLIDVAIAARPLSDWFGRITVRLAEAFHMWAEQGRQSGQLEDFFRRAAENTELATEALFDFGMGLVNIGRVARRVWGQDLLKDINDAAEAFRKWTASTKGQEEIARYFRRWRENWRDIAKAVADVYDEFKRLRSQGKSTIESLAAILAETFAKAIPQIANHLAAVLPDIAKAFVDGFLSANAWGKLVLGVWLLEKFGGLGAAVRLGGGIATGVAEGFMARRAAMSAASAVPAAVPTGATAGASGAGAAGGVGGLVARGVAAAGPVGIAAAVAALVVGGVFLALSPDQRRAIRDKVAGFFKDAFKALNLGPAIDELKDAFGEVTDLFSGEGKIAQDFQRGMDQLGEIISSGPVKFAIDKLGDLFETLFDTWIGSITRALPGIGQALHGVTEVFHGFIEIIAGILTLDFGKVWDGFKLVFKGAFDELAGIVRASTAPLREAAAKLGEALIGPIEDVFLFAFDKIAGGFSTLLGTIADLMGKVPGFIADAIPGFDELKDGLKGAQGAIDDFRDSLKDTDDEAQKGRGIKNARERVQGLKDDMKDLTKGTEEYRQKAKDLEQAQEDLNRRIRNARGAAIVAKGGFLQLTQNVGDFGASASYVSEYTASEVNKLLREFGAKPLNTKVKPFRLPQNFSSDAAGGYRGGGIVRRAVGGLVPAMLSPGEVGVEPGGRTFVVPGKPVAADNVMMHLRRGTAILTGHGQQLMAMGASLKDALQHQLPHFAGGGVTGGPSNPAGGVMGAGAGFIPLMQAIQRRFGHDVYVFSGLRPGSRVAGSGRLSNHGFGRAVDITHKGGESATQARPMRGAIGSEMDRLHSVLGSQVVPRIGLDFLWRTLTGGNHYNHIHLGIRDPYAHDPEQMIDFLRTVRGLAPAEIGRLAISGGTRAMRQALRGQANRLRRAGNRRIARIEARQSGGPGGFDPHAGEYGVHELARLWVAAGGAPPWRRRMGATAVAESGGDPRAESYAGAKGLWQILGSIIPGDLFNPMINARNAVAKLALQGWHGAWTTNWSANTWNAYNRAFAGWRRGGIVGGIPGFQGGGVAGLVGGAKNVFQSTNFPVAYGRIRGWGKQVARIDQNISNWGTEYGNLSRRFDLSEEDFIDEGEVDDNGNIIRQPSIRKDQVEQRRGELERLIKIRDRIVRAYKNMLAYVKRIRSQYQRMLKQAEGAMARLRATKKDLGGRPGKQAKNAQERVEGWIKRLQDRIGGLRGNISAQTQAVKDTGFNLESAQLDADYLRKELFPLLGGGLGLEVPEPFKQDVTADQSAIADQANRRAEAAQAELFSVRTALRAFASAGDIGQGAFSARDAVLAPTGIPGPGYAVGPGGQLVPVVGAGQSQPLSDLQQAAGGGGGTTVIFQSVVPYTAEQAAQVAGMTTVGIEGQRPTIGNKLEVRL